MRKPTEAEIGRKLEFNEVVLKATKEKIDSYPLVLKEDLTKLVVKECEFFCRLNECVNITEMNVAQIQRLEEDILGQFKHYERFNNITHLRQ